MNDGRGADGLEAAPERALLTRPTATYVIVNNTMRAIFRAYFRRRVEGVANLPREGGILLVANHQSFLDIPLVAVATPRHVSFVARDSLARSGFLAFVMRECGAVLVRRGQADRAALREMVAHLQQGDCVAVYPEGTRTSDGRVGEFRAGALLAARQAGVPIVPVGIRGTFEAWPRSARLPRPKRVALRFGSPIDSSLPDALERARSAIEAMVGDGRFASVAPAK